MTSSRSAPTTSLLAWPCRFAHEHVELVQYLVYLIELLLQRLLLVQQFLPLLLVRLVHLDHRTVGVGNVHISGSIGIDVQRYDLRGQESLTWSSFLLGGVYRILNFITSDLIMLFPVSRFNQVRPRGVPATSPKSVP